MNIFLICCILVASFIQVTQTWNYLSYPFNFPFNSPSLINKRQLLMQRNVCGMRCYMNAMCAQPCPYCRFTRRNMTMVCVARRVGN